jgi:hypothetical protein
MQRAWSEWKRTKSQYKLIFLLLAPTLFNEYMGVIEDNLLVSSPAEGQPQAQVCRVLPAGGVNRQFCPRSAGIGTLEDNWQGGCTATSVRKWSPLKRVN